MKKEEWRDIPNYIGIYQVSDLGNVRSVDRFGWNGRVRHKIKGIELSKINHNAGYYFVNLSKQGKSKPLLVHQLVAIAFLNHIVCDDDLVVDHINTNKKDNTLSNLQVITHRHNTSKDKKGSSIYTGVYKYGEVWRARISVDNKRLSLGYYMNEIDAHNAYQDKLKEITNEKTK